MTGAASGIGRATAIAAAREGAELVLTDIDAARLDATIRDIRQGGGTVLAARAFDVAEYEAVRDFAREVHDQHGSLDVVMNIAGISIWGRIDALEHRQWRKLIDVNLMGPIHVMECFLPAMIAAKRGGWLVNVSSAAGLFGLPWHAAYSASKFGLRGVSEVLRFDLARHRIGVSLVCPGGVRTGLVDTIQIQGVDIHDPAIARLRERFARHAITPEDAASQILKGIKAKRYLVLTSFDVRVGYWFQRKFSLPYEWVMHLLNRRLNAIASASRKRSSGAAT